MECSAPVAAAIAAKNSHAVRTQKGNESVADLLTCRAVQHYRSVAIGVSTKDPGKEARQRERKNMDKE